MKKLISEMITETPVGGRRGFKPRGGDIHTVARFREDRALVHSQGVTKKVYLFERKAGTWSATCERLEVRMPRGETQDELRLSVEEMTRFAATALVEAHDASAFALLSKHAQMHDLRRMWMHIEY